LEAEEEAREAEQAAAPAQVVEWEGELALGAERAAAGEPVLHLARDEDLEVGWVNQRMKRSTRSCTR